MKYADIGTDEQFVREFLEVATLLDGVYLPNEAKKATKELLMSVMVDGVMPAFLELRAIRESKGKDLPVIDRHQLFEDFTRKIWKAYKDLTQTAVRSMGFNIGFLYQGEKEFESGLADFRKQFASVYPNFELYLRGVRNTWQNDLSKFRNSFVEHQQAERSEFAKFYDPELVEELFFAAWRTVVNIFVMLMNLLTPPWSQIVEHCDEVHGPGWPNRFRWDINVPCKAS
jgi:hypothetical protein